MEIRPLAIALLLAGCIEPPVQEEADPGAPGGPGTIAWTMSGCRELAAFFEADPTAVRSHFPAGFEPTGTAPGRATIGVDAFHCDQASGLDGPVADAAYISFWAAATPPQELRGNVSQWYVKWLATVADPLMRAELAAQGMPVTAGTVAYTATSASMEIAGVGRCTLTFLPGAPTPGNGSVGAPLREFTAAADGLAVWEATLTRPNQTLSTGMLQVPAGSVLADIAGTTTIPVTVADGNGGGLSHGTITRWTP